MFMRETDGDLAQTNEMMKNINLEEFMPDPVW